MFALKMFVNHLEINYMKLFLKMVEIHSLNSCAEANARDFSGEIEQQ